MLVRKRNRLPGNRYLGQNWYFVTACAAGREPLFLECELVETLLRTLAAKCSLCSFNVYAYCFMPDHAHFELVALRMDSDLIKLLREFKGATAAEARSLGIPKLWQRSSYDHILRPDDDHNAVAWYIFNNPVRKGLANDPRAWPHSGSWMFNWKKAVAPPGEYVPPWSRNAQPIAPSS